MPTSTVTELEDLPLTGIQPFNAPTLNSLIIHESLNFSYPQPTTPQSLTQYQIPATSLKCRQASTLRPHLPMKLKTRCRTDEFRSPRPRKGMEPFRTTGL